jgi:hypothetical protein
MLAVPGGERLLARYDRIYGWKPQAIDETTARISLSAAD